MTDRIRSILQRLEQTREDLLALWDDIWLSIDHNDPQAPRSAMALPSGVYAQVNLSANHLRDQIKALLGFFEPEHRSPRIFLRQDRDAEGGD